MAAPTRRMAVPVSESGYRDFRLISGTTGATIHVLNQKADYDTTMALLQVAGLRPYTYQEILLLLTNDGGLKIYLKDTWFYLAGSGPDKKGVYTVDEKGELVDIEKKNLSAEEKVFNWPENKSLPSLEVSSNDMCACLGWRFSISVASDPHVAAPIVVGTPISRDATAPKDAGSLFESVQAKLTNVQARRAEIKEAFNKEDEQLAKMENKLKDALSKAKEADNANAQVKGLIRDAEDSEKFVIAAQIGAYAKLKNKNRILKDKNVS